MSYPKNLTSKYGEKLAKIATKTAVEKQYLTSAVFQLPFALMIANGHTS